METKRTKSVKISDDEYLLLREIQLEGLKVGQSGTLAEWLERLIDVYGREFCDSVKLGRSNRR